MTTLELQPIEQATDSTPDMVHLVCCHHRPGDSALCGDPETPDTEWVDESVPAECVVCIDLCESHWCPQYGRCRVCR
jgi:hypothetical protein